jgi:cytochrome c biogenesis protein CcmG/thiol:disulfide interchange protein DsbE
MTSTSPPIAPGSAPQRSSTTAWIVAGVLIAVIALVAVIAIVASGGSDDDAPTTTLAGSSETQPATITGDPLPAFQPGGSADAAVGVTAPTVSGRSFDGTPVSIEPGRVTMLAFLAHWCPHCQREVPTLTEWAEEGGVPEGVDVIGIATATAPDRPNYPPSAWLAEEQFPFPTMADDAGYSVAQAYGLPSFPYFVALDAEGKVAARAVGELSPESLAELLAAAGA